MFRSIISSAVVLLSSVTNAQSTISNYSTSACPSPGGVHVIVARASLEQEGYGIIGAVKDFVLDHVPGSTAEFVVYPATLNNYFQSESDGVVAMRQLVNNFISSCSASTPLVLLGYSQGAQVAVDTLVGQQVAAFPDNTTIDQPLSASILSQVAALVVMGDPTFTTTEFFHVGNATKNSIFPRKDVSNFDIANLASRTRSYCDYNDPYCASGNFSTGLAVHVGYVKEYGYDAELFILDEINAWYANQTNGTSPGYTASSNGTAPAYGGSNMTSSSTSSSNSTSMSNCPPSNSTSGGMSSSNSTSGGMSSSNSTSGGMTSSNSTSGMSNGTSSGGSAMSTGSSSGSSSSSSASSSSGSSGSGSGLNPTQSALLFPSSTPYIGNSAAMSLGLGKAEALTGAAAFGLLAWIL